jgi:hypothetical protein
LTLNERNAKFEVKRTSNAAARDEEESRVSGKLSGMRRVCLEDPGSERCRAYMGLGGVLYGRMQL